MVHFFSANVWLNISRAISVGTGMLLTVAFANLLTPEAFGTYKYVIASAGFIATFSLNGLGTSILRAVAQGKYHVIPTVVRTAILWSIPASMAALAASAWYFGNGNNTLGFAFLFIALTNSLTNGIGTTKGVWLAAGDYRMATFVGLPKILVPFAVTFCTILLTQNVVWILLAYFGSHLSMSWVGYRFMLWWFGVRDSQEDVPEVVRFGKQMTFLGFFQLASTQIDQLLLWHFTTPATLAIYALALSPVNEAQNLLNNFLTVMFRKIAAKDRDLVHKMLPFRMRQMFLAALGLTVVYVLTVPLLFTYLFPKYMVSIAVSQVLALTLLLQPKGIIDAFFTAHGEIANRSRIILTSQIIRFGLFITLIPTFGLWGAVCATILSELCAGAIYLFIYLRAKKSTSAPKTAEQPLDTVEK